jgi:esterase/lipase
MKNKTFFIPLLLILLITITSCMIPNGSLEYKHEPTGLHTENTTKLLADSTKAFQAYLTDVSDMIKKAGVKGVNENESADFKNKRIDAATPFEWGPGAGCDPNATPNGALLIHGLTDSPFLMRDIGKYLTSNSRCFLVRSILLPGHGTVPGDLLDVKYKDWIEASAYGINSFPKEIKNIYIVGFSTGGTLALYHTLNPEKMNADTKNRIKGLILLSPAVQVKSEFAAKYANWHKIYSWAVPNGKWLDLCPDVDYAKYESFPKNAGDQIHLLANKVYASENQLNVPIFVAMSNEDETVDTEAAKTFFTKKATFIEKGKNDANIFILYASDINKDYGDNRIKPKQATYNQDNILNYAHVSIPVSPENEHYGRNGNYYSCSHYSTGYKKSDDQAIYACCAKTDCAGVSKDVKYGETSDKNKKTYVIQRLTYNPSFVDLTKELDEFLKKTGEIK